MSPRRYSRFAKPCLLRELRAELDHLRRVIDRDDFARGLREQLRERAFAGAEVGHG